MDGLESVTKNQQVAAGWGGGGPDAVPTLLAKTSDPMPDCASVSGETGERGKFEVPIGVAASRRGNFKFKSRTRIR
jgi:hypothetical protein